MTIAADKRPVIRRRKKPTIIRTDRNKSVDDGGGGRWTKKEDALLRHAVKQVGAKNWKKISVEYLKGTRSDVQCLHRWQKVLRVSVSQVQGERDREREREREKRRRQEEKSRAEVKRRDEN